MRVLLKLLLAGVVILLGGCTSDSGSDDSRKTVEPPTEPTVTAFADLPASSEKATNDGLSIQVVGTCDSLTDREGHQVTGMRLDGSGFAAGKPYHTEVWYPDGKPYTYIRDGKASAQGTTPNWTWDCYDAPDGNKDEPGKYRLVMTDGDGKKVETTFVVSYDK